nr:hypothetical protein [Haloferax sp. BAB-2207]
MALRNVRTRISEETDELIEEINESRYDGEVSKGYIIELAIKEYQYSDNEVNF